MLQRFRDQFGTAGLIVGVVALIAALAGTAIAASGLNSKQKKQVTSIAKKYAGKDGATGATGPKGDKGDAGTNGNNGNNGSNGADGQSVEAEAANSGECPEGGTRFKVGGVTKGKACNGEAGEDGETGFTEVLPEGETETGTWGGNFPEGQSLEMISIPIPLPGDPEGVFVGKSPAQKAAGAAAGCDGFEGGLPVADPGKLCVYMTNEIGTIKEVESEPGVLEVFFVDPQVPFGPGTAPEGAGVLFNCEAPLCTTFGSWAATAPEAP